MLKKFNIRFIALFLLSAALIGYELAVMRSFSVGSWSNFGSMVISIALLGFGLAGVILTFIQKKIKARPNFYLNLAAMALLPAMALSHVLAQLVPFSPVLVNSDIAQILWIGVYYLVYAVPFFIGAVFINLAFILFGSRMHALYFWNMTGSGLGGLFILFCMYLFPPDLLSIPLLLLTFLACVLSFTNITDQGLKLDLPKLAVSLVLLIISLSIILFDGKIRVSEHKNVYLARHFPDSRLDYYSFSPLGEMHVYSSSYFHFSPGQSDVAAANLSQFPQNAFKGLYIDGNGPIGIMRKMNSAEERYMDYIPMSLPYLILEEPDVLLIKLGGGISTFTALYQQARSVTILESNPELIHMIRDVPLFQKYTNNLLRNQKVTLIEGEPRAYCQAPEKKYDLVEISLIDSVGLNSAGGYSVDANYTYTVEAIKEYLRTLNQNGILSITVWNRLIMPRNVPKLLTTVVQALEEMGFKNPGEHLFVMDFYPFVATVLIKNSAFNQAEIDTLKTRCERLLYRPCYYPGIEPGDKSLTDIFQIYRNFFAEEDESRQEPVNILPDEFYRQLMLNLTSDTSQDITENYLFDIRPLTDNRPYYTAYLKPFSSGIILDQLKEVPEEWGYLLQWGTFFQSILFGLVIIMVPLFGRWKELFQGKRGTLGIIIYYACLGLGYMIIEIFLIQKLVFFLAEPIFSVSIVITSMLIISALGSLTAGKLNMNPARKIRLAVTIIGLTLVFYIFGLTPILNSLIGLSLVVKALIAIILIAPSAFFMGMPFPTGLTSLEKSRPRLLPWALGMNGALSVTGAVLAKLISISAGFQFVLVAAILLYAAAGLVFPANTKA